MFDIFYLGQITKHFNDLKQRIPTLKHVSSFSEAKKKCLTKFFWIVPDDIIVLENFDFSYTPDDWSEEYVHVFKNGESYDGIFLLSKNVNVEADELIKRNFLKNKKIELLASNPKQYDVFEIDSYEEYLHALENSTTEMFWMSSRNIKPKQELIQNYYISHYDSQLRNQIHAFVHNVDEQCLYNGLFLCSKQRELTKHEVEYRFPVNRIEHNILGSSKNSYSIVICETYNEYLDAIENPNITELFWTFTSNVKLDPNFKMDLYFTHDNEYDRKQNHNFIHRVDGKDYRNGVFLLTKHRPLTQREFEHRFIVNAKEWDIVASGPVEYPVYEIDSYDEYIKALETSPTEMFWMSSANITAKIPDLYFTHDNKYDRTHNHNFLHCGDKRNGLFLCSKHVPLTKREVEYRFVVNAKEWDIEASNSKAYDVFEIDSYEEYLHALETSTTEMFWMSSKNISATIPDIYFSHDNEYDRKQNHAFIHRVDDRDLYNGLFLCSKHVLLTKREVEYRHPVNRKEWDIVASGPCQYEIFYPKNYDDYLDALKTSKTEMFWIIPDYVNPTHQFKFNTYFSFDQTYDREINHAYLNGKYHDGILLCSKYAKFSKREFDYKFIAAKKEVNIVISTPKPYDIVFISYQEPNADENYIRLIERFPNVKRIHGIKGIHQAHIEAAKLCNTDMFWIVDGDAIIVDDFKFNYQVARWDKDTVHVWRSQNPINDLVYGYGGVKLFPTELTVNMDTSKTDMTTSISSKFKAVNAISNITAFNSDSFNTWKSAFRECVKLSSKIIDRQKDKETEQRLNIWRTKGEDRSYGEYAILGANAGMIYGQKNQNDVVALSKINDFEWLKEQFDVDTQ